VVVAYLMLLFRRLSANTKESHEDICKTSRPPTGIRNGLTPECEPDDVPHLLHVIHPIRSVKSLPGVNMPHSLHNCSAFNMLHCF
jgi:hypothetical protein